MTDTDTVNQGPWTPLHRFNVYNVDRLPTRCAGSAHHGDARLVIEVAGEDSGGGEIVLWGSHGQSHAVVAAALVAAAGEAVDHLDADGAATLTAAVEQLAGRLRDVTPVPYLPAAAATS